jgi:hypothetical protein
MAATTVILPPALMLACIEHTAWASAPGLALGVPAVVAGLVTLLGVLASPRRGDPSPDVRRAGRLSNEGALGTARGRLSLASREPAAVVTVDAA